MPFEAGRQDEALQRKALPYYETGRKSYAKMSDSGGGSKGSGGSEGGTKGGDEESAGGGLDKEKGQSSKPGGNTTLTRGSEGFREMQAREKGAEAGRGGKVIFKGAVTTLLAIIVPGWIMYKIFGDPDRFGMVGFSLWVLGSLLLALLASGVIGLMYRE